MSPGRCNRRQVAGNPSASGCRAARRRRPHCWPPGFTLVELLLALGLLLLIAALSWPALERPFHKQRLRAAADRVRSEWCLARVEAIRSGATCVFQFVPGDRSFRTERRAAEAGDAPGAWQPHEAAPPPMAAPGSDPAALPGAAKTLPEHVVFGSLTMNPGPGASAAAPEPPPAASEGGWSDAICFYPDGTTSDVRLELVNDQGSRVELTLRGLTGTVAVGAVQAAGERLP